MGAIGEGEGNNKAAWVTWIHTPATCKECKHYDKNKRRCGAKECPYPARRGRLSPQYIIRGLTRVRICLE